MNDFREIRRNEAHRAAHYRTGIEDKRVHVTLPVVAVGMAVADKIPFAGIFCIFEGLYVGTAVREEDLMPAPFDMAVGPPEGKAKFLAGVAKLVRAAQVAVAKDEINLISA